MRKILAVAFLICSCVNILAGATERPSREHEVYFQGSDYELHVYTIYGRRDGNTIFMLGGIQGDEPGGYLSADLYTNLKLEQGNLIIIPRANLKSVILYNRGPDGDMNRLFIDNLPDTRMDYQVVKVVMDYMAKADMFLNLHDGWGFHSPTYINEQRNPRRFGQSLIVDEDMYTCADGREIDLKAMANSALAGTNSRIPNEEHHLAYFNTQTGNPKSMFKDMQKTATWYALRNYCIPAFGVESSKNISSVELKVLYHNYVVNEFMKQMEVIPENPPIYVAPAVLEHALITVNGESMYVSDGDVVNIRKDDIVSVKHIETNFTTGVSCDILGFGNLNDLQKDVPVGFTTKIIFRKEDKKFAEVTLQVDKATPAAVEPRPAGYVFDLSVDGKAASMPAGGSLTLKKGSILKVSRVMLDGESLNLPVNLRGWVPSDAANTGDDRGYDIVISRNAMLAHFSTGGNGSQYPITVDRNGKEVARMYIIILD